MREGYGLVDALITESRPGDVPPQIWIRAVMQKIALAGWLQLPLDPQLEDAALLTARQSGEPSLLAETLNGCSVLAMYEPERSYAYLEEAAQLAQPLNDAHRLCETRLYESVLSNGLGGDPHRARATAEESLRLAVELGDTYMSSNSRVWLGCALHLLGAMNDAAMILSELTATDAATDQPFNTFLANLFLGRVRAYQGEAEAAQICGRTALATAASGGLVPDAVYAMVAEAALVSGDVSGAKAACEASWRHTYPVRMTFNRILNPMAEALLACGDLPAARRWADDNVALLSGFHRSVALSVRAQIALAQGEPEQAAHDAREALAIAAETNGLLRVPDALEGLARATAVDGSHPSAVRLLGAADALRRATGIARFPMYEADYDAALESCRQAIGTRDFDVQWNEGASLSVDEAIAYAQRGHGKRKRPSAGWESLTPTENDVVRLVRDGLTNKDIAARLLISPRTVQTHLTHVYTKLGLASRVHLVREASRHT